MRGTMTFKLVGTMTVRRLSSFIGVGILFAGAISMFLMGGFSADARPSKAEAQFANLAKEVVIPLEAQTRRNPLAANDSDAQQQGMALYQQSCSVCHGADGRSDIAFGRAMYRSEEHTSELQSLRHLVCRL